jgi:hypothetical protein
MEGRMALIEDMFKGNAVTGVAVGLAAIVLGPTLFPAIGRVLRPAVKTVLKGGIVLYEETVAGIGEFTSDLVEEARSELREARAELASDGHGQPAGETPLQTSSHDRSQSRPQKH